MHATLNNDATTQHTPSVEIKKKADKKVEKEAVKGEEYLSLDSIRNDEENNLENERTFPPKDCDGKEVVEEEVLRAWRLMQLYYVPEEHSLYGELQDCPITILFRIS